MTTSNEKRNISSKANWGIWPTMKIIETKLDKILRPTYSKSTKCGIM
ncbi:hypothetical protein SNOG_02866 [Parastagonospora nodorum SN15]|uniref:Uncharacterized protein n=1 Tax=Phaeosphaeria nodorum (strain SN15 / ATCC MYA-4574 / FGSC 10173) TaxID=321614 RepID=Q0UZE8_PHANO|nr:hypothetical protein SNOG_02866 [Parastagonospora nodorum SN15]EAT89597.1 hypothetical protein SNOG_02866 [Parastagonospora nodorum SN15]